MTQSDVSASLGMSLHSFQSVKQESHGLTEQVQLANLYGKPVSIPFQTTADPSPFQLRCLVEEMRGPAGDATRATSARARLMNSVDTIGSAWGRVSLNV